MSLFDLSGQRALVSGASRGLGLQMAGALARAGADLVITARDVASLKSPVDSLSRTETQLSVSRLTCNTRKASRLLSRRQQRLGIWISL